MKRKNSELHNLMEQTKKREKIKREKVDLKWIITIGSPAGLNVAFR